MADEHCTVNEVMQTMFDKRVSALPVVRSAASTSAGLVDLRDLIQLLITEVSIKEGGAAVFFATPIGQAVNASGLDVFDGVEPTLSLYHAIEAAARGEARLVTCDPTTGEILGIVSPIDMIAAARPHLTPAQAASFKATKKAVVTTTGDVLLRDALPLLRNYSDAVAVVDENGVLVSCLSVSDATALTPAALASTLSHPLVDFLTSVHTARGSPTTPITIAQSTPHLGEIIDLMMKHRVHRIFSVDADNKPTGVFTLTEVAQAIQAAAGAKE
jgi:CBS domain-containing protein